MGRRPPLSRWQQFCRLLSRRYPGQLSAPYASLPAAPVSAPTEGAAADGQAPPVPLPTVFAPARGSDVQLVLELCEQWQVKAALWGMASVEPAVLAEAELLWLDPAPAMSECRRLSPDQDWWFVLPGCPVGELADRGLAQFSGLPRELSVAAWLADRETCDWAPGQLARSGIRQASLLLNDGEILTLGPFGANSTRALEGMRLQQLIPELFRMSSAERLLPAREAPRWPGRFRLDAMTPRPPAEVNLAHLLAGHGGALGWVQWLVVGPGEAVAPRAPASAQLEDPHKVRLTDHVVRDMFDPAERFWMPGDPMPLPSAYIPGD